MTRFELVKQNVCTPKAAVQYGLEVSRNGMARCPFPRVASNRTP